MGNLDPAAGGDFRREKAEEILLAPLENRATIGRADEVDDWFGLIYCQFVGVAVRLDLSVKGGELLGTVF